MKAIILNQFGDITNFQLATIDTPIPQKGEVLIRIKAIGINPVDYKTRIGKGVASHFTLPAILGWDIAGEIVAIGEGVQNFSIGEEVFGMNSFPGTGNAYAEFAVAKAEHFVLKPANITFQEAAAIPLAALTAWQALVRTARISKGDKVLIHAAAGGVGHFAVQIAKERGAFVIGTASGNNKEYLRSLGVDQVIDYTTTDFTTVLKDIDIVLDGVGGETAIKSLKVVRKGGTLITLIGTSVAEVRQKGQELGIHTPYVVVESDGEDMEAIARLVQEEKLHVHVSAVLSLEEVAKAHQLIETARTRGKIVLSLN